MQKKNKGLFVDVDGTLIRWVYYDYWIRTCVEFELFPKYILIELDQILSEYKQRELNAPFTRYLEAMVRAVKKQGVLKGVREVAMIEVCKELARRKHGDVHVFTRELITAAHTHGYMPALVSGSPTLALQQLMPFFPGVDVCFGTRLGVSRGKFTGEVDDSVVHNKQKAVHIYASQRGIDLEQSIAIGDSPSDVAMFNEVRYPIALNPNVDLYDIASDPRAGGIPIVLEKKMVIPMKPRMIPGRSRLNFTTCLLRSILPPEIAKSLQQSLEDLGFM